MTNEEIVQILQELLKSIKTRGSKKTINLLKSKLPQSVTLKDDYDKFIIREVAAAFDVDEQSLLYTKYVRGDSKYALGLCVHYLYEKKSLGEIHKNIFTNKNKTLLSKYRQMITFLEGTHPEEKKILDIKKELDKKIKTYKKK